MQKSNQLPTKLAKKLQQRIHSNGFRKLSLPHSEAIDFYSNDYLGFGRILQQQTFPQALLQEKGSRLICGHHSLIEQAEGFIAQKHQAEKALLFNSGYTANLGFFSTIPQRGDTVIYDAYIHASIRDGLKMGLARSYAFQHNNLEDLALKISKATGTIYLCVESVYSMDGDIAPLKAIAEICKKNGIYLIVDEAHSIGIHGKNGLGLVEELGLATACFARIVTYGKAMGCSGAVVLGSSQLYDYLVNFCRPFIYTTAIEIHATQSILNAYKLLDHQAANQQLWDNIAYFRKKTTSIQADFLINDSPIQGLIVPGNEAVVQVEKQLKIRGFNVKAIRSPTVEVGQERLRISLHSYNTFEEIDTLINQLEELL